MHPVKYAPKTCLVNRNKNFWIVEKTHEGRNKYRKKLGKISKEEAQDKLAAWKSRLEVKPIYGKALS